METAFLDADIYDHVDALLARFPGLCFEIYHDDRRIHVLHPNDYTRNHEHLTRAKTEEVKDFREVDLPIIKLLFEEEKPLWSRCAILSSLGTGENATSSSFRAITCLS